MAALSTDVQTVAPPTQFAVPVVYFNGFNVNVSNTDLSVFLLLDGQPAIKIVMPLPVAKSMSVALDELVKKYENVTQTKIYSNEEIISLFAQASK